MDIENTCSTAFGPLMFSHVKQRCVMVLHKNQQSDLQSTGQDVFLKKRQRPKKEYIRFTTGRSIFGTLAIAHSDRGICAIFTGIDEENLLSNLKCQFKGAELSEDPGLDNSLVIIADYIKKPSKNLAGLLDIRGSEFQKDVWGILCGIPSGTTLSYKDVAKRLGVPNGARAVARACATNALAIVIPCHRVVSSCGALAGYRWGLALKKRVLDYEQKM